MPCIQILDKLKKLTSDKYSSLSSIDNKIQSSKLFSERISSSFDKLECFVIKSLFLNISKMV